jgi:hypothetical protein
MLKMRGRSVRRAAPDPNASSKVKNDGDTQPMHRHIRRDAPD